MALWTGKPSKMFSILVQIWALKGLNKHGKLINGNPRKKQGLWLVSHFVAGLDIVDSWVYIRLYLLVSYSLAAGGVYDLNDRLTVLQTRRTQHIIFL